MAVEIGSKACDFILKRKTAEGMEDYRLSDNFGKKQTVILFVPLAFTPVCTKEFCQASRETEMNLYSGLDAEVIGISVDSPFSQEAWAKQEGISIPMLSDLGKEVTSAYGLLCEDFFGLCGVSNRAAFVVNKEGVVTYKWVAEDPMNYPDFEGIQKALQSELSVAG